MIADAEAYRLVCKLSTHRNFRQKRSKKLIKFETRSSTETNRINCQQINQNQSNAIDQKSVFRRLHLADL